MGFKNPFVIKVFPRRLPKSADEWNTPQKLGVSLIVGYYPPIRGRQSIFQCKDTNVYFTDGTDNINDVIAPDVDLVVGYGLACWDLFALYQIADFQFGDNVEIIDIAELLANGDGIAPPMRDIIPITLFDYKFISASNHLKITEDWISYEENRMDRALRRAITLTKGIYALFHFVFKYGYVLTSSSPLAKGIVKQIPVKI